MLVHPKMFYYNASYDSMSMDYYGTRIQSGTIQFYHDAGLTSVGTFKEQTASPGRWFIRSNFTCTGWYVAELFFADGTLAIKYTVEVEAGDLVEDRCQSDHTNPTDQEKEDEENGNGIGSGDGGGTGTDQTECWTKICECIAQLNAPLNQINTSIETTNSNLNSVNNSISNTNNKLDTVNNNLGDLKDTTTIIKDVLTDFRDEFKTNIGYTLPENPSVDGLLEKNKPVQNETPFVDDTIYFKDEGDAQDASFGKLPKAPEPKHWDGMLPESAIPPEVEKNTDSELSTEVEKNQDKEIDKDIEVKKDSEKSVDVPLQTDVFSSDAQIVPASELNQSLFFEQTNKFGVGGDN